MGVISPTSAPNSVSANVTNSTAPGPTTQPGFAHTQIALRTAPLVYFSSYSDDQDENPTGPLMKPYFLFTLRKPAASFNGIKPTIAGYVRTNGNRFRDSLLRNVHFDEC
jgi:hypothetical protein